MGQSLPSHPREKGSDERCRDAASLLEAKQDSRGWAARVHLLAASRPWPVVDSLETTAPIVARSCRPDRVPLPTVARPGRLHRRLAQLQLRAPGQRRISRSVDRDRESLRTSCRDRSSRRVRRAIRRPHRTVAIIGALNGTGPACGCRRRARFGSAAPRGPATCHNANCGVQLLPYAQLSVSGKMVAVFVVLATNGPDTTTSEPTAKDTPKTT